MKILSTQYNILYSRISNLRKIILGYEDMLLDEFTHCQVIPIPDEAPPEIPRVTTTTKSGYSTLQISLTGTVFHTIYDNNFNEDWDKCHNYLNKKSKFIYGVMNCLGPEQMYTQGFAVQILLEGLKTDPVEVLKKGISLINTKYFFHDLGFNAALVKQDKYYINIQLSNARITQMPVTTKTPVHENDFINCLILNIEVNDRKQFNENNKYKSSKEVVDELLKVLTEIIKNGFDAFIETGVLEL